jgi:predicted  nucleic acid-binding Zn-ribbon protein
MFDHDFRCMECGRRFKTVKAAERAANEGCPKCGSVDIDLAVDSDDQGPNDEEE